MDDADWGRSANEGPVREKIRATMPADSPGALNSQRTVDLVAYILNANKFPSGDLELPPDPTGLRSIVFTTQKP